MISISLPLRERNWNTISFASTLYLCPILDLLLAKIPPELRPEIRLGLQEALVNAAKHGNKLDPSKTVVVKFSCKKKEYSWVISDQGSGFISTSESPLDSVDIPSEDAENGRGFFILHTIFDQVNWNRQGNQLRLCRKLDQTNNREPLFT